MNIKENLLSNSFWLLSKNISGYLIRTIAKIVLARIFLPEDFGLIALSISIIDFMALLGQFGIATFVVYNKSYPEDRIISTALCFSYALNAVLFFLLLLLAYPLESFFNKPPLGNILLIFSSILWIWPLQTISVAYLERNHRFKQIAIAELISIATYALLALGLCLLYSSFWMLLIAHFTAILVNSLGVFMFAKIRFSAKKVHKRILIAIITYGKYILGQGLLVFSKMQYDNFVVAKYLSAQALGFYIWAFTFASIPVMMVIHAVNGVAFPIYCELQHDRPRMLAVTTQIFKSLLIVLLPALITLAQFSQPIIGTLFSSNWYGMVPILKIFCLYACFRCFLATYSPLLNSIGSPKTLFYANIISLCIGFVIIPIAVRHYDMKGAAWAITFIQWLDFAVVLKVLNKEFPSAPKQIRSLGPIVLANIILNFLYVSVHSIFSKGPLTLAGIGLSLFTYGLIILWWEHPLVHKIRLQILHRLKEEKKA